MPEESSILGESIPASRGDKSFLRFSWIQICVEFDYEKSEEETEKQGWLKWRDRMHGFLWLASKFHGFFQWYIREGGIQEL